MIIEKDLEYIDGQMDQCMKGIERGEKKMEKELILIVKESDHWVFG